MAETKGISLGADAPVGHSLALNLRIAWFRLLIVNPFADAKKTSFTRRHHIVIKYTCDIFDNNGGDEGI